MRIKDIAPEVGMNPESLDSKTFFSNLQIKATEIQETYVRKTMDLLDQTSIQSAISKLGSKIEPLMLVDEMDRPYRDSDGWWASEFRKDCTNYAVLPESKERTIFYRVAFFILEDSNGNPIVSRRSALKSHPLQWEIAGGHVSAGDGYLETCIREVKEELGYDLDPADFTEEKRLFKFRNVKKAEPGTFGRGIMLTSYRVQVPTASALSFDPGEIAELRTMAPNELHEAIASGEWDFVPEHAYCYLEYLKQVHGVDTSDTMEKLSQSDQFDMTRIPTFSEMES